MLGFEGVEGVCVCPCVSVCVTMQNWSAVSFGEQARMELTVSQVHAGGGAIVCELALARDETKVP